MTVKIKSPASVSNLTCGFDTLGMAIGEPFDLMQISLLEEPVIRISHEDAFGLPEDPDQNIAGIALKAFIKAAQGLHPGHQFGFDLKINKQIKPGSGLGSSAASAAGAVVGANHLLGNIFSKEQQVDIAMEGEKIASGARHPDNVVPCIYGGLNLIRSMSPLDVVDLSSPPMFVTVVHPQIELKTSFAREILPKEVALKEAARQWANLGALVAGFLKGDYGLIARSMEDRIIEPVRKHLVPGYEDVIRRSKEAGALGGGISGSGPAMFMLTVERITAETVEASMIDIYSKLGIEHKTYVTTVNKSGAVVFEA